MNAVVFVAAIVAVVIALMVLSRASGRKKRMAREDLKREQEQIGRFDILDLVRQELDDTGAGNVPGGEDVDPTVLLRVWKRDEAVRDECSDASLLHFVVADGVAHPDADVDTVKLLCDDEEPEAEQDDAAAEAAEAAVAVTPDDEADTAEDNETEEEEAAGAEDEDGAATAEA